jgi:hypothetical protein
MLIRLFNLKSEMSFVHKNPGNKLLINNCRVFGSLSSQSLVFIEEKNGRDSLLCLDWHMDVCSASGHLGGTRQYHRMDSSLVALTEGASIFTLN